MAQHNETGTAGESKAVNFLKENGYIIHECNWQHKNVEIDIIAQDGKMLIIAEVKTRTSNAFGEPEVWVTRQKQKNIIKAASAYIEKKNLDLEVRFDIISVMITKDGTKINHIKEAFYPLL